MENRLGNLVKHSRRYFYNWSFFSRSDVNVNSQSTVSTNNSFNIPSQTSFQNVNSSNFSTDTSGFKKRSRWLDFGIVKENGRAFDADKVLIPAKQATIFFPLIESSTLDGETLSVPHQLSNKQESNLNTNGNANNAKSNPSLRAKNWNNVKLVTLSFKHYGSTLVKSWQDPFISHFQNNPASPAPLTFEICFVEYSFLSLAKNVLINSLKAKYSPERHPYVGFTFGGVTVSIIYLFSSYFNTCF